MHGIGAIKEEELRSNATHCIGPYEAGDRSLDWLQSRGSVFLPER